MNFNTSNFFVEDMAMVELVMVFIGLAAIVVFAGVMVSLNRIHEKKDSRAVF